MPPKRKSTDAPGPAKKSRPAKSPTPETDPAIQAILNKRWSSVSITRNADESCRMKNRDPVRAFTFICLGRVPWTWSPSDLDEDEDSEDEDEDEDRLEKKKKKDAEANPASLLKPAAEYPDEKWIFTNAGIDKWIALIQYISVRDPDNFGMYVCNDSAGYGGIELVENLMLDFEEAKGDWKKQWAVCEAAALYFTSDYLGPLLGCECGQEIDDLCSAVPKMFLSLLTTLERNDLLKPDSEIKNLGALIGLFIRLIIDLEPYSISRKNNDSNLKAYAAKYGIKLLGLNGERYEKPVDGTTKLPSDKATDPWGWKKVFAGLKRGKGNYFGGDRHDITSWTPAERKRRAFDKKDPFPQEALDMIKKGGLISSA